MNAGKSRVRRAGAASAVRRSEGGATLVEFALVAGIFFLTLIGLVSAVEFVFEAQVANDAAQAAAEWSVGACNTTASCTGADTLNVLQCGALVPPGMVAAAQQAAGPFAGDLAQPGAIATQLTPESSSSLPNGSSGCEVTVTLPYSLLGGYFGFGGTKVRASATDYIT